MLHQENHVRYQAQVARESTLSRYSNDRISHMKLFERSFNPLDLDMLVQCIVATCRGTAAYGGCWAYVGGMPVMLE
eukprot:3707644-Karenia_brevis.AAC.1